MKIIKKKHQEVLSEYDAYIFKKSSDIFTLLETDKEICNIDDENFQILKKYVKDGKQIEEGVYSFLIEKIFPYINRSYKDFILEVNNHSFTVNRNLIDKTEKIDKKEVNYFLIYNPHKFYFYLTNFQEIKNVIIGTDFYQKLITRAKEEVIKEIDSNDKKFLSKIIDYIGLKELGIEKELKVREKIIKVIHSKTYPAYLEAYLFKAGNLELKNIMKQILDIQDEINLDQSQIEVLGEVFDYYFKKGNFQKEFDTYPNISNLERGLNNKKYRTYRNVLFRKYNFLKKVSLGMHARTNDSDEMLQAQFFFLAGVLKKFIDQEKSNFFNSLEYITRYGTHDRSEYDRWEDIEKKLGIKFRDVRGDSFIKYIKENSVIHTCYGRTEELMELENKAILPTIMTQSARKHPENIEKINPSSIIKADLNIGRIDAQKWNPDSDNLFTKEPDYSTDIVSMMREIIRALREMEEKTLEIINKF